MALLIPSNYESTKHSHYSIRQASFDFQSLLNSIALRMAKTLWSFGQSECKRVKIANAFLGGRGCRGDFAKIKLLQYISVFYNSVGLDQTL